MKVAKEEVVVVTIGAVEVVEAVVVMIGVEEVVAAVAEVMTVVEEEVLTNGSLFHNFC
jgi:hypothetical protein